MRTVKILATNDLVKNNMQLRGVAAAVLAWAPAAFACTIGTHMAGIFNNSMHIKISPVYSFFIINCK